MAQEPLGIRVLAGEGAINSIRMHRGHDPVVQVVERGGAPVAGAIVTFLLPATGPSAVFQDNGLSLTTQTGPDGQAVARGLRPNRLEGRFRIRVTASWHGQNATATLQQTNAEPIAKSKTSRTIVILAIVGGAVAGGVLAAAHGGSSNQSTPPPAATTGGAPSSGATIVAGPPVLGPPH